jgi:beta-lactamase superfamily II metal-dependent hydrolase
VPFRRLLIISGVAVLAALALLVMLSGPPAAPAATSGTKATIRFVDVGQGDGVVMRIGNKLIVSDVGEHNVEAVNAALAKMNWRSSRPIDVAILSHPHQDHVFNFRELARTWKVKMAVISESNYWSSPSNKKVIKPSRAKASSPPT